MKPESAPSENPEETEAGIPSGEKLIKPGDRVNVLRSSGEIEQDWHLLSYDDKYAIAFKEEGERILKKKISLEKFIKLQEDDRNPIIRTIDAENPREFLKPEDLEK